MRGRGFAAGVAATMCFLAWAGPARAGDTIRLNMVDNTPTKTLVDDGRSADTIRTWHRGFGGYGWGGYHGYGWGGYRGFGYGGYRSFGYGGFYRPYFGYGGLGFGGLGYGGLGYGFGLGGPIYGSRYYGLGFGRLGYGFGYSYGGFYPGFGLGYGGFFPCAGTVAGVYTMNLPTATLGAPLYESTTPPPANVMPAERDGTYPYDGGPREVVPAPQEVPAPSIKSPQRSVPLEGRSVSLPKVAPKWTYPAYGETAKRVSPAQEETYLTRSAAKKTRSQ